MTLAAEIAEVICAFGGRAVLLPDDGVWAVEVRRRGRSIIARHAPDHPFSAPWVYLDPSPCNLHYYVHSGEAHARLCWCTPWDWSPSLHLLVAVCAAIRFLNEEAL
jgi:hypothetical protein